MFWRQDPRDATVTQKGGDQWPRNGSVLKGTRHEKLANDMDWLEVSEWKQASGAPGADQWVKECTGLFMPFEQGGPLLHKN